MGREGIRGRGQKVGWRQRKAGTEWERRKSREEGRNKHTLSLPVPSGIPVFKGYLLLSGTSQMAKL